jgi:hypothetical protein
LIGATFAVDFVPLPEALAAVLPFLAVVDPPLLPVAALVAAADLLPAGAAAGFFLVVFVVVFVVLAWDLLSEDLLAEAPVLAAMRHLNG